MLLSIVSPRLNDLTHMPCRARYSLRDRLAPAVPPSGTTHFSSSGNARTRHLDLSRHELSHPYPTVRPVLSGWRSGCALGFSESLRSEVGKGQHFASLSHLETPTSIWRDASAPMVKVLIVMHVGSGSALESKVDVHVTGATILSRTSVFRTSSIPSATAACIFAGLSLIWRALPWTPSRQPAWHASQVVPSLGPGRLLVPTPVAWHLRRVEPSSYGPPLKCASRRRQLRVIADQPAKSLTVLVRFPVGDRSVGLPSGPIRLVRAS